MNMQTCEVKQLSNLLLQRLVLANRAELTYINEEVEIKHILSKHALIKGIEENKY